MGKVKSAEIREKFLAYFERQKHTRVKSASLIPVNDPTLYFTNAGMVQFKNVFTGVEPAPAPRATSSQKCMRVSGKHNDLENVGHTKRHHTFFEMLGNFSFGDYFKKEAVCFAWQFLTQEMGLPQERLWVTIYEEDDEAEKLWLNEVGIPHDRILKFGKNENYWSMGETGPCGPCSEIHYDHGERYSCGKPDCRVNCDCDRYMEVWNLVFMQYDRDISGKLKPLPQPSIDTGMGLERLAAVVQGKHSNYESDLFTPLFKVIEKLTQKKYESDEATKISMQVLADHIRAATFLIADGIQPSNEGRGYVLRRIMRRAIRHGRLLGMTQPFFYKLADTVIKEMAPFYPELKEHQKLIDRVIMSEEEKFLETLEKGLDIIEEEANRLRNSKEKILHGDTVFKLYDTYGFPVDLTQIIVEEKGFQVDMAGFEKNMEIQKGRGRQSWKGATPADAASQKVYDDLARDGIQSRFLGHESLKASSRIAALIKNGHIVDQVKVGDTFECLTFETPFYPEGGGQVGDHGWVEGSGGRGDILETRKMGTNVISHTATLKEGILKIGDEVQLVVDQKRRRRIQNHHSATHILHAALRQVLGTHVRQAGSLVEPGRLRFDFSHFEPVDPEELRRIEDLSNEAIRSNHSVTKATLSYEEAMKKGALAFFEEKYGDQVRVVKMGDYSCELCGGSHVEATGEIGLIKIINESSVAAGVRRIEAVVGEDGFQYLRGIDRDHKNLALELKTTPSEIKSRVVGLQEKLRKAETDLLELKKKIAMGGGGGGSGGLSIETIKGISALIQKVEADDVETFRSLSDQALQKVKSGIVVLGCVMDNKVSIIVRVSKDLIKKFHAGKIIQELAPLVGGKGGGRPDMAQAGGQKVDGLEAALKKARGLI
ncbi:MAG: alanine--tRNA ligase [Deltaproteobacteria bacterium RIFCSPLOWO2_02_FULL_50_16]|nr:MAG: alanine--tRNA ligase [Deltaproteobacteria bacterium RIFCSPLOWO2_02_FULL_50_16]